MSNKMLFLKRSYNRNGDLVVDGAAKIFLKPDYNTKQLTVVRSVDGVNGPRTVCNLQGDAKIDEFLAKQIKYFFGADLTIGEFLNIRVGVWGHMGDVISKFELYEKDLYLFFLTNVELNSFTRQNGSIGFQLTCSAYDFEKLHGQKSANGGNGQQNAQQNAQQYAPQQPQRSAQPNQQYTPQQPQYQQQTQQRNTQYVPQQPAQPQYQPQQQAAQQPAQQQYAPQQPPRQAQQQYQPRQPQYAAQPAQQYAPQQNAPQQNSMIDDFAAIEESEDLPF